MSRHRLRRNLSRLMLALPFAVGATVAGGTAVLAQSDPYSGGSPTSPGSSAVLHLVLSAQSGSPGKSVEVKVCCAPAGQVINVQFNGITVISGPAAVGVGVAMGRRQAGVLAAVSGLLLVRPHATILRAAAGGAGVDGSFVVPAVAPGPYEVCASTAGVAPACAAFTVTSSGSVLGTSVTRSDSGGSSSLARTGFEILLFILVAVGFLILGRFLVRASRKNSSEKSKIGT